MWWQLDALELFYIVDLVKRALVTGYAPIATQSRLKHALRHHAFPCFHCHAAVTNRQRAHVHDLGLATEAVLRRARRVASHRALQPPGRDCERSYGTACLLLAYVVLWLGTPFLRGRVPKSTVTRRVDLAPKPTES